MWKRPLDNGGMEIVNYIITVISNGYQLYTEDVDGFTDKHSIGYSFTPDTTYEVRLKARSEAGPGYEKTVFVTTDKYCEYLILNFFSLVRIEGSLRKPRWQRQREHRQTKDLMSKAMAVYVRYNSWYISLPCSAKQHVMDKFCVSGEREPQRLIF